LCMGGALVASATHEGNDVVSGVRTGIEATSRVRSPAPRDRVDAQVLGPGSSPPMSSRKGGYSSVMRAA
jgi:hypothetical protein